MFFFSFLRPFAYREPPETPPLLARFRHFPKMATPETFVSIFTAAVLLLLLTFPPISGAQEFKSFSWGPFTTDDGSFLNTEKDASISGHALQITPDSLNADFSLFNRSGRVTYFKPFQLWKGDKNSTAPGTLASFHSSFLINIFRPQNRTAGEGLAFVIAPNVEIPSGSEGQWLGLTNATIDGKPSNQFVAIELDTLKESFDPDGNHIGLDINSVVSNVTYSLSRSGIELSPVIPMNYTVWVDYDARGMLMSVYIVKEGKPKPDAPVINETINLKQIVNQNSYFGFAASTGNTAQLNCVLKWNLTVEILSGKKDQTATLVVAIGVPVVAIVVVAGVVAGYLMYKKKKMSDNDLRISGALKSLPGTPREFRFRDLKKATNNFDDRLKLGEGGFGIVYKGVLPKENIEVAVKKFSRENIKGKDDFLSELTIINRLRHKHLVKLVGWCHKNGMLLLVYDYMPNGSLDSHLFGELPDKTLSWDRRYNILADVASALNYLHHEYDQTVVHRDLKASNIMLDSEFNARLGDFGLARALENEKTSYAELEGVAGTLGYIAPECFHTGKATRESDVFGFGAVVLEMVCGKRPRVNIERFHFLVDWVWTLYREGRILDAVDERLGKDYVAEDAERLLKLGLACSHPIAAGRPKTQTIVQIISRSVAPPWVPPIKPAFIWPMEGPAGDDGDNSSMTNDSTPITSSYYGSQWTPQFRSGDGFSNDHSMV